MLSLHRFDKKLWQMKKSQDTGGSDLAEREAKFCDLRERRIEVLKHRKDKKYEVSIFHGFG